MMGLFDFFREKRETATGGGGGFLESVFKTGYVTATQAMEIPPVGAVLNFIAGTITALPVRMYKTENGQSVEIEDDYRLYLLNKETGDMLDSCQFKAALIKDYILNGNGYAFVNWRGNAIKSLHYIEPWRVSPLKNTDPVFKTAEFRINGKLYRDFSMLRVLRNTTDGATGKGLIDDNQAFLSTMISAINYERKATKSGGKRGYLKTEHPLEEQALKELRKGFERFNNSDSNDSVMILNKGLEFQDASVSAVESQLNENKQNNANQLYRLFGLSSAVMNGTATENEIRNAIRTAIMPIAKQLENAFNRFCLLESEKGILEFVIDLDELDTTSILARYQAYEIAVRNGFMVLDEVRYQEGMNPLGLDFVKLGLDTVIYDPKTKTMYTPNTKEEYALNGENKADEEVQPEGGE